MLNAEFRKTWCHPVLWIGLVAVCIAQFLFVAMFLNPDMKEFAAACNAYAGAMDHAWQERVHSDFDAIWNGTEPEQEEYWNATQEQRAVLDAVETSYFSDKLEHHIAGLKLHFAQDSNFDLNKIDAAYARLNTEAQAGKLNYGISPAGSFMVNQRMVMWCFVLFMMVLCIDQFSSEQTLGMYSMQLTTKKGRKQLYWTKLAVCQLSAGIVWLLCNGAFAVVLTIKVGWGIMDGVIQDFTFNASPFTWNTTQYLLVVLSISFLVSQIVAVVIFWLASISKSAIHAFGLIGMILVFPMLLAQLLHSSVLALWLPGLIDNAPLWTNWSAWRIGSLYIRPWIFALAELGIVCLLVLWAIHCRASKINLPNE